MSFLRKAFAKRNVNQPDGTPQKYTGAVTVAYDEDLGSLTKDFGFKAKLGAAWGSSTISLPDFVPTQKRTARGVLATPTKPKTPVSLVDDQITGNVHNFNPTERVLSPPYTKAGQGKTTPDRTVVETDNNHSKNGRSAKKKPSTSTFRPCLTNLAGFKHSSTTENRTAYPTPDEDRDSFLSAIRQQSASFKESYPGPSTSSAHDNDTNSASPFLSDDVIKRRNRRKRQPLVAVAQSVAESNDSAYLLSPAFSNESFPSPASPSDVPDPHFDVKISEEAAKQARLNAENALEDSEYLLVKDQEPPDLLAIDLSSCLTVDKGFSNLTPKPESDFAHRRLEESPLPEDERKTPAFIYQPESELRPAVPPSSPLPIFDGHANSETQLGELRLLRVQLEQSKTRIDSLAQENSQIWRDHRREVDNSIDQLKERETVIKQLTAERDRAISQAHSLDLVHKELQEEKNDILQQLEYQVEENHRLEEENKELQKECLVLRELKKKMENHEREYQELTRRGLGMQKQLDAAQHKLSDAERRVRCLDRLSRQKYEAKQEGAYGSGSTVGRSTLLHHSPHVKGPSMDVIDAVDAFNGEILQAANLLVENLERKPPSWILTFPTGAARAKKVWGLKVVEMLEKQARNPSGFNFLLMQNCLEVFVTHWCVEIIEGWYPFQPSFSDVLVELASQTDTTNVKPQICGKRIKVITTNSADPDLEKWVQEMVEDISSLLRIGGFAIQSSQPDLLSTKFHPILKLAYNLRLALAERDICGTLELAAPFPDSPFHPEFMEEEHPLERSQKKNGSSSNSTWYDADYISGTTAIGLKRTLNGQPGVYEMVLKPKVVLIRVLEAAS